MCQKTEEEAANAQEQKYKPKLFSFFPSPSLKWRYVSVNNKDLASNSSVKMKDSNLLCIFGNALYCF
ncbi:hypothetical protein BDF21DRAFT_410977 [Thamnidium elegans]|nr:hypothetical protein BDF21DRAFT_410977 [Thamnidium elegans]